MGHYGINDVKLQWFKEYLKNHSQMVSHLGALSDEVTVDVGVPRGSVLALIFLVLFVNDISKHASIGTCNACIPNANKSL